VIHITVEAFSKGLIKDFSQIGTAVAEEGGNPLQLDIIPEVVVNVINDIIQYGVSGRTSGGIHNHFCLSGNEENDFIQITALIDAADNLRVCGKRNFRRMERMIYLFLYTQE